MDEVTAGASEPLNGEIVTPGLADRTVAFFLALGDDEVDKNWGDLGKLLLVLGPTVLALTVTKGRSAKKGKAVRELIAPAIALGKLVSEVNRQVTPDHLNRAQDLVKQAKRSMSQSRPRPASKPRH